MDAQAREEAGGVGDDPDRTTRWGKNTRSEGSVAKELILDAALRCYKRLGVKKTSIGDIAAECRVTRPTVYRYFNSHDTIAAACMRLELDRLYGDVDRELASETDFAEYLTQFLVASLRRLRTDEFWFLTDEKNKPRLYDQILGNREVLYSHAEALAKRLRRDRSVRVDLDCLSVADWRNRLLVSYFDLPSPFFRSDGELLDLFRLMIRSMCHPPPGFMVSPRSGGA